MKQETLLYKKNHNCKQCIWNAKKCN